MFPRMAVVGVHVGVSLVVGVVQEADDAPELLVLAEVPRIGAHRDLHQGVIGVGHQKCLRAPVGETPADQRGLDAMRRDQKDAGALQLRRSRRIVGAVTHRQR